MVERVNNGDFETGDFTSWTVHIPVHFTVTGGSAHTGSYGVNDYIDIDQYAGDVSRIGFSQDIDLTNIDDLTFYYAVPSYSANGQAICRANVYIDGVSVWSGVSSTISYTYVEIDVSGYSGVKTVGFGDSGTTIAGTVVSTVYFDDISAVGISTMQINIGDSWKEVNTVKINIGDSWKNVVSIKQNIGDAWKTVF